MKFFCKLSEHAIRKDWHFAASIGNSYEADGSGIPYCNVNIAAFSHSYWFEVPELFSPQKKWVDISKYEWAERPGYWDNIRRQYGFSIDKTALHLYYGIQPGSWSKDDPKNSDHSKCYFIPWNQSRRVKYDFVNPDGTIAASVKDKPNGAIDFDAIEQGRKSVQKSTFKFNDFDGEEIIATCHIEETVYRKGEGWFKWLGYIISPTVYRSLDLWFSKEIGREKGSWKGGTMGHSVELLPTETPLAAFTRYGTATDYYKNHGHKLRGFTNIVQL